MDNLRTNVFLREIFLTCEVEVCHKSGKRVLDLIPFFKALFFTDSMLLLLQPDFYST